MLRIGLTGGIASGKSVASDYFASLGIPVIDTDLISRELVQPGSAGLQRIIETFGESVLDEHGALDRSRLREIVFTSDDKRTQLEDILHPAIRDRVGKLITEIVNAPYAIIVIPLLFETRYPIPVDRVLVIDADENRQLKRLLKRDDISLEQARAMLRAQASREERIRRADDVARNDGTLEALQAQLQKLHQEYLKIATNAGK
jgi:dephospho-CoA kinase